MSEVLQFAFKEWAVVAAALVGGRQAVILRKGGIAEERGQFTPDHARFWIYPTYVHQQQTGIRPEAAQLWHPIQATTSLPGEELAIELFAEVEHIAQATSLDQLQALQHLHIWSEQTVTSRFHYRQPGLYVLVVRVWRMPEPHRIALEPAYEGCKTWVELRQPLSVAGAIPVLTPEQVAQVAATVRQAGCR